MITIEDIRVARRRIEPWIVRTPLIPCERLSKMLGAEIAFKAENLQHVGAFKTRGAVNAVMSLDESEANCGVVTHSSGNHAAALARAAGLRRIPAHIVMPENSAWTKIEAVRSYGVEPVFCEPDAESRAATAERVRQATGACMVHPYDHPQVMAGQGTVGLEILEQWPDVDMIVVPVGGGGLLSGMLTAIKSLRAEIKVIAAEPEWADDASRSLTSGRIEAPTRYDTVADGLRTPLGELTFPIIRQFLDDLVLVSEASIRQSMRMIAESAKLVAEPSGAVTLAAILHRPELFQGMRVALVISGGNLDFGDCKLGG